MKDSDIDKAIELRKNRDEAFRHSDRIYNYILGSDTFDSYKFAFSRLSQEELDGVGGILVAACKLTGRHFSDELELL
jgi:hypothetical protein